MTLDFIRLPYVEATLAEVHRCGSILPGAVRHKAIVRETRNPEYSTAQQQLAAKGSKQRGAIS